MTIERWIYLATALLFLTGGCKRQQPQAAPPAARQGEAQVQLHTAASRGDVESVRSLIAAGADVNARSNSGATPLHEACSGTDDGKAVAVLIDNGADLNAQDNDGHTALHRAARSWREPVVKVGEKSVIQLLVACGAQVNARDKDGATPLHHAAFLVRGRAVKHLLAMGADVNARDAQGETPLHEALKSGHQELIERIIARGADVNAADRDGWTPLHTAAFYRLTAAFDLLVARGASLNSRTKEGRTPLDLAQEVANREAIVLSSGAEEPYAVIVTDPGAIDDFVRTRGIDFDRAWIPASEDVEWIPGALKTALDSPESLPTQGWFEHEYMVTHLSKYNREYAGFIRNGTRHVICNMHVNDATRNMYMSRTASSYNRFAYVVDGGGAAVRAVFDVESRTLVHIECNGM